MAEQSRLTHFFKTFKYYLLVNSTEQPTYLLTRQHVGSYAAVALAAYNTFLLKQKIIKNAIWLTRSNKPKPVTFGCILVGTCYFGGLSLVWHIPSFFAQLAVRVYCASQNACTTMLVRKYLMQVVLKNERIDKILREYK